MILKEKEIFEKCQILFTNSNWRFTVYPTEFIGKKIANLLLSLISSWETFINLEFEVTIKGRVLKTGQSVLKNVICKHNA